MENTIRNVKETQKDVDKQMYNRMVILPDTILQSPIEDYPILHVFSLQKKEQTSI